MVARPKSVGYLLPYFEGWTESKQTKWYCEIQPQSVYLLAFLSHVASAFPACVLSVAGLPSEFMNFNTVGNNHSKDENTYCPICRLTLSLSENNRISNTILELASKMLVLCLFAFLPP